MHQRQHNYCGREAERSIPRNKEETEGTTEFEEVYPQKGKRRKHDAKKRHLNSNLTIPVQRHYVHKRPETAPIKEKNYIYDDYYERGDFDHPRLNQKNYYEDLPKKQEAQKLPVRPQEEVRKYSSRPRSADTRKYLAHSYDHLNNIQRHPPVYSQPNVKYVPAKNKDYTTHREPPVYVEEEFSDGSENKSVSSKKSSDHFEASCEMAAVKDLENLLSRYEHVFESAIATEVERRLGPVQKQKEPQVQHSPCSQSVKNQPSQQHHSPQRQQSNEFKQNKDHIQQPLSHLRKSTSQKIHLTREQQKLLEMDKPPIEKLKDIPIQFLKPRLPPSLKGETFQQQRPQSPQYLPKPEPSLTEEAFSRVKDDLSSRGFVVSHQKDAILDLIEEEQLKAYAAADISQEDIHESQKKIPQPPPPYIHPDVEKMFSIETTKKIMKNDSLPGKTVSTQTLRDIDNRVSSRSQDRGDDQSLFYKMDTERKGPYLEDINNLQENWRDVLAQQNSSSENPVPVNPLLAMNSILNASLCINKSYPQSSTNIFSEKSEMIDKSVSTESENRVCNTMCNKAIGTEELKDVSTESQINTIFDLRTKEKDEKNIMVYQALIPQTGREALVAIGQQLKQNLKSKTNTSQILDAVLHPPLLVPQQIEVNNAGGGDSSNNQPLKIEDESEKEEPVIPKRSELEELNVILKGELDKIDFLVCLKILQTVTNALLKFDSSDEQSGEENHLKEMKRLRRDHIKHIQKEIHHLEELDKFLKKFEMMKKERNKIILAR